MKDVWGHSGSMDQSLSELEIRHRTLAREAAVEGIVLLKNEGVLPLSTASAIALLGSGAEKTIKGGIGSGDVNNRENISIYQGMKEFMLGNVPSYSFSPERYNEEAYGDFEKLLD